jgi:cytochrome c556
MRLFPILFVLPFFYTCNAVAQPSAKDNRTAIYLMPQERSMVLAEMRHFLEGVDGLLHAALIENMALVEKTARPLGMQAMRNTPVSLKRKLPAGFTQLGAQTHKVFQAIADDARDLEDPQQTLEQLKTLTGSCIACHRAYRFETASK